MVTDLLLGELLIVFLSDGTDVILYPCKNISLLFAFFLDFNYGFMIP